jgi:hypothetical protein
VVGRPACAIFEYAENFSGKCQQKRVSNLLKLNCLQDLIAQPFMPPNLLQSTTASFLSILSLRRSLLKHNSMTPSFAAILLPSPHTPSHRPTNIINQAKSTPIRLEWPTQMMCSVHDYFFCATRNQKHAKWGNGEGGSHVSFITKGAIGEPGMYI